MVSDLMVVFDCLDGLQMRGSIRWQEFRWQELHVLAESRKQEYGYYNINLLGSRLVHFLPKWGKHVTQHGQARCPRWADFVLSDRIINCCPSTIGWGHNDITE